MRVHYLALGGADLTSAAGQVIMTVLAPVAQFERDLIVERTQAGLARAESQENNLERLARLNDRQKESVRKGLATRRSFSPSLKSHDAIKRLGKR